MKNDVNTCLSISTYICTDVTVSAYSTNPNSLMDEYVTIQIKHVLIWQNTQWINDQVHSAKVVRRRLGSNRSFEDSDKMIVTVKFARHLL